MKPSITIVYCELRGFCGISDIELAESYFRDFHQVILAGRKADQGKAAVQEVKAEARLRNKKVASKCVCFKVAFPLISLSFSKQKTKRFWRVECFFLGRLETDLNIPSSKIYMKL